jgi:hypothetical protein
VLIDLSSERTVIDPSRFAGTLAIQIDNGGTPVEPRGRPECGVFSGRGPGTNESEMERRQPEVVHDQDPDFAETGIHIYLIDRPERRAGLNTVYQHHYVAVTWRHHVYLSYAQPFEITLSERGPMHLEQDSDIVPDEPASWDVAIHGLGWIILPDYEPGHLARGRARLI